MSEEAEKTRKEEEIRREDERKRQEEQRKRDQDMIDTIINSACSQANLLCLL